MCVYMYVYTTSKPQEKGIQNVMESFKKVVPVFPCSCSLLLMVCFPNVSSFFSLQKKKTKHIFLFFCFYHLFQVHTVTNCKGIHFPVCPPAAGELPFLLTGTSTQTLVLPLSNSSAASAELFATFWELWRYSDAEL